MARSDRDRRAPVLIGLGVGIAFVIESLILPIGIIFSPLFTPIVAVPLGTLRIREGRVKWLGTRQAALCWASASMTWLSLVVIGVIPRVLTATLTLPLTALDKPMLLIVATFEGALAAWFASLLQTWAERRRALDEWTHPPSNPRTSTVAAQVGGALLLMGLAGLALTISIADRLVWTGSTIRDLYLGMVVLGVLAFVGVLGLAVNAGRSHFRTVP